MSANAWTRRREGKRFAIALKCAIRELKRDPDAVIRLPEWGLVVISPEYYDKLQSLLQSLRVDLPIDPWLTEG